MMKPFLFTGAVFFIFMEMETNYFFLLIILLEV